jgi:hypothetical protein
MTKLKSNRVIFGMMIALLLCREGFSFSRLPRYAQVTVQVHRYEGGAFVVEQLKTANAHAGVSCKEVTTKRGTVIVSTGFVVVCGYGLETSMLPSQNIIEIYSYADTDDSRAAADKIYREFISAIRDNPEVTSIECFVGKKSGC